MREANLEKVIKEKEKELKILHKVAEVISSDLELKNILEFVIHTASNVTNADSCLLYLYDCENKELKLQASKNPHPDIMGKIKLKIGEGLTGWVAKEKNPVVISSEAYKDPRFKKFVDLPEDKYEAFLSIPILSKDKMVGVINVQHKKPHNYPESQIKLLFTVARYIGSAIENAKNYEEANNKAKQLDFLSLISKTIVSDNYLKEILNLIVTMTAQVMNSKICSIVLLDDKKQELVITATQSLSSEYINKPNLKVGQSITGKAVQEKKPIAVLDVTKEKDYMYKEIAEKEGIVSLLSVPMMIKDKVIGVINIYTDRPHYFTREEINILQSVANQAAVAIENTRLNQELLAAKDALETRKIIERAKGILMKKLNIGEEEAYRMIQKKSMDLRKPMKEIAEAVILVEEL